MVDSAGQEDHALFIVYHILRVNNESRRLFTTCDLILVRSSNVAEEVYIVGYNNMWPFGRRPCWYVKRWTATMVCQGRGII